jgi:small subunit ribosomal protein S18
MFMINKRRGRRKKRVCQFCVDKITSIDYKELAKLRKYVSERGKILPRRVTGNCAKHQRAMTMNVKRARHMSLMVYTQE